jgi:hypothetical protein
MRSVVSGVEAWEAFSRSRGVWYPRPTFICRSITRDAFSSKARAIWRCINWCNSDIDHQGCINLCTLGLHFSSSAEQHWPEPYIYVRCYIQYFWQGNHSACAVIYDAYIRFWPILMNTEHRTRGYLQHTLNRTHNLST